MISSMLVNIYVYVLIHWIFYILGSASLLLIIRCSSIKINYMFSLSLFKHDVFLNTLFVVTCCSIIGIPPFMGFWTKLFLLLLIGKYGILPIIILSWFFALISIIFYLSTLRNITTINNLNNINFLFSKNQINLIFIINLILLLGCLFFNQLYLVVYLLIL